MKCYRCGKKLTRHTFCPHCGADVKTYSKVLMMSNTYYNMGLTKAQNRDLQGAAIFLRQSVKLDKYNTNARNLLGLVYMEMGEIVQAMAEWLISQSFQPENNLANVYIKSISSNQNRLAVINQSIRKFNIALKEAKNGNDDVAIIQLKRVILQNPNLVKAQQLLALLLMKDGQVGRARKILKKSLKIDKCNPLTLKYMRAAEEMIDIRRREAGKSAKKKEMEDRPYLSGDDVIIPQGFLEQKSGIYTVFNVLAGIVVGILAFYFLVVPGKLQEQKSEYASQIEEYDQTIVRQKATITQYEQQISSLQTELDAIKADTTDEEMIANYESLLDAYYAFTAENPDMEEVAEAFRKVKENNQPDSEVFKSVYQLLADEIKKAGGQTGDGVDGADNSNDTENPDGTEEPDDTDYPDGTEEPDDTENPDGTEEPDDTGTDGGAE